MPPSCSTVHDQYLRCTVRYLCVPITRPQHQPRTSQALTANTSADGPSPTDRPGMQSIPSGSFSHQGSSSHRESSGGASSEQPSGDENSGGKPVSSLNVLAKPFTTPGMDPSTSDSQSLSLKSPGKLIDTPGPCPSQVTLTCSCRLSLSSSCTAISPSFHTEGDVIVVWRGCCLR